MPWYIKAVLHIALPAACLAALYLSIPGEISLAKTAGWSDKYAPAMPVCLSVYALSASAIATYRRKMRLPGQMTALIGALMALILAMSAQSISHLIEQTYMEGSALLTVTVSCIPPLVIGHLIHMAETPSQAVSASEEIDELRETNTQLFTALVDHEGRSLISRTVALLGVAKHLELQAGEAAEEAAVTIDRIEADMTPRKRTGTRVAGQDIEEARERLAKESGEKPTVARVCEFLGISPATYYRNHPRTVWLSEESVPAGRACHTLMRDWQGGVGRTGSASAPWCPTVRGRRRPGSGS
ncbi:hypothetical protein AB0A94_28165 [Streptomyces sp. NPDC044984]|uniref:hypothetical protein n=1 Tax=Streptomyces sp. NPDC044984 TaxID=3154335 RepID=UPI0033DFB47A